MVNGLIGIPCTSVADCNLLQETCQLPNVSLHSCFVWCISCWKVEPVFGCSLEKFCYSELFWPIWSFPLSTMVWSTSHSCNVNLDKYPLLIMQSYCSVEKGRTQTPCKTWEEGELSLYSMLYCQLTEVNLLMKSKRMLSVRVYDHSGLMCFNLFRIS